jgi:hypothetical protein
MTDIATLRTTYVNGYVKRSDGDTVPWLDADCNQALTDALGDLWPDIGKRAMGTVATDSTSHVVTLPAAVVRVSRIDVEDSSGNVIDQVTNWRYYPDADPPTKITIKPKLQTGYTLRVFGYAPFGGTGSDLLVRLENVVSYKAAALLYGVLAAALTNSQRQQALDSGRVVDYQTAIGLSAYWERRYQEAIADDLNRVGAAPRASRR